MKILTQSEVQSLSFKSWKSKITHPVTLEILRLNVGQSLLVTKEDWGKRYAPGGTSKLRSANVVVTTRSIADGSGWVVTRLS